MPSLQLINNTNNQIKNRMKSYIVPTIKVKKIDVEVILAASNPASSSLNDEDVIKNPEEIEAKKYGNVSLWDDDTDDDR